MATEWQRAEGKPGHQVLAEPIAKVLGSRPVLGLAHPIGMTTGETVNRSRGYIWPGPQASWMRP
jgi:hypothetical protein